MSGPGKEHQPITYSDTGVNYGAMDPLKRMAQLRARSTSGNLERFGMKEVESSRGESAYVWDQGATYGAFVVEGLGTKNMVADEVRKFTGKTHYDSIAQDTVAMIVNDLITVGAAPQVVNAYFAVGESEWFSDKKRTEDLVEGWTKACDMAGAVYGGGESPTLKGIIDPKTIDLSGSAVGIIKPKERYATGDKIKVGDAIFLIESSGIHANGLTLARTVADMLPNGYQTKLSDGGTYGEALLRPTHIYAKLIEDLFNAGVDIHYMANITGHGWRKLMRAERDLSYIVDIIPEVPEEFSVIQRISNNNDREMYGNFNMGAGFALFMPNKDIDLARQISMQNHKLTAFRAGHVDEGERKVIIRPKDNLPFEAKTLGVR